MNIELRLKQKREAEKRYRQRHPDRIKKARDKFNAKNPGLNAKRHKQWYQKNKEHVFFRYLKWKFGLEKAEYLNIVKASGNKCQICREFRPRKNNKRLMLDHCHKTRAVRGLLCNTCNIALGMFKEDLNILKNAVKYLGKFK